MKKIITTLSIFLSFIASAQTSRLEFDLRSSFSADSNCYRVCITRMSDTIHDAFINTSIYKVFDSLMPGLYKINLYRCSELAEIGMSRSVQLFPDKITVIHLDFSSYESYLDIDPKLGNAIKKNRQEIQLSLSYVNSAWTEKNSYLNFGSGLGLTFYQWLPFSRHIGILGGLGFGVAHYGFSKDTTFMNLTSAKKTNEFYNYLNGHGDLKFKISFDTQQDNRILRPKMFLDIGAVYYAPILFRHIARYENNKKISNARLHQFTDFRVHVDFGYSPMIIFAEYRLLDFIIGEYPELPKYNFGIKLTLH